MKNLISHQQCLMICVWLQLDFFQLRNHDENTKDIKGTYAKISKSSWYQGYRNKYLKSIYLNRCILLISFWVSFSADMRTFMDLFVATYQFFPTNNCNHSCMPWYQNMLQWLSCPTKILRIWKERKLKSQRHDAPTDILRNGGM